MSTGIAVLRKQAGQRASELFQQAKDYSEQYIGGRKADLADKLVDVGDTVRRAADKLYDQGIDPIAGYVDGAAQRVKRAGRYLEDHEVEEMFNDLGRLARRRPVLVLGTMFLTGVLAARFVKAPGATAAGAKQRRRPAHASWAW